MKNKFVIPIITGLIITLSLYLTIIVKSGTAFEIGLILAYVGIGAIGFIYSFLLQKFKMYLASSLFLLFSILSGIYFYVSMPMGSDGLSQLAAFLGWIVTMVISVFLPLLIEFINRLIKNRDK